MKLPTPGPKYDQGLLTQAFSMLNDFSERVRQRQRDVELGPSERLIVTTPNGSRRRIVVSDAGAISTEAVT